MSTALRALRLGRRWLPNLALATASLVISAVLAEIAIRLLRPQPIEVSTPGFFAPDPPRRYRLTPGYRGELTNLTEFRVPIAIGPHGLRGAELPPKAAGEKRLLMLGDSFVFGWGVEEHEAPPALLQAQLAPEHPGWRVVNAGIPGFGIIDEVDWLETWGLATEPNAVLLGVYLGNDLIDATALHRLREVPADGFAGTGATSGWRSTLYRGSHLVRLLKKSVPIPIQIRLCHLVGMPLPWSIKWLREELDIYSISPTPLQTEGRAATRDALVRLQRLAKAHRLPLALVLFPARLDLDSERWSTALESFALDPAHYRPDVPARMLTHLATETGVAVLDLSAAFKRERERGAKLYFEHDPHWNAAGNALVSRETYPFVISAGLLSG